MIKNLDIKVHPQYLDAQIRTHILDAAKRVYENTSMVDIGYIIKVDKLLKINQMYIDTLSSFIYVNGDYKLDVCYPNVGSKIEGCTIQLILNHGIFAKYYNIDILIPVSTLQDYTFDHVNKTFTHKRNNTVISQNNHIDVTITDFRYHNNEFSCIGEIKI